MLDITNLVNARDSFKSALEIYEQSPLPDDSNEKKLYRDGAIHRFVFTFELSWKMIKRYQEEYGFENADMLNIRDLFRAGYEQGLIDGPEKWFGFLKARDMTSHLYDDTIAAVVFKTAREFLPDADYLIDRLNEKIGLLI